VGIMEGGYTTYETDRTGSGAGVVLQDY